MFSFPKSLHKISVENQLEMISEVKSSAQELNKKLLAFNKDQTESVALNYLAQD